MIISYDIFAASFLAKITEYNLLELSDDLRTETVDGYMGAAMSNSTFKKVCKVNFATAKIDNTRTLNIDGIDESIDEIVDIVSEGMIVQWLKPYVYKQELLENVLNSKDFSVYSPAELLLRVGNAYSKAQKDFTNMIREYSYNHGDLTDLHL